jgi:exodeoxyribonuclease VII large subunit
MKSGDTLQLDFEGSREVLSVTKLNRKARLLVEGLGKIWVEGEISNLSQPSSGHMYWSLKDSQAQVRCAMFRQANRRMSCKLENGLQVMLEARVSIYEARGDYQLIVDRVEEAGVGLLQRRFEELKRKLADEGLFDAERKKALPTLPARIGVITSPTGAALRDVLIALRRRFPATRVLIYPSSVQGEGAPAEICRSLALADRRAECDLLILTRGGGSLEDLWAFNDERVARAVAALELPIIVGVGHEIDFTIADFVADMRAPTPSQAAELAVPDSADFLARLSAQHARLARAAERHIGIAQRVFAALAHRLQRAHPGVAVRSQHQRLDELEARLKRGLERAVAKRRTRLGDIAMRISGANPRHKLSLARNRWHSCHERLRKCMNIRLERLSRRTEVAARALQSLSPLATLERGYAIVSKLDDSAPLDGGRVVTHSSEAPPGTRIAVRLAHGRLTAGVELSEPSEE